MKRWEKRRVPKRPFQGRRRHAEGRHRNIHLLLALFLGCGRAPERHEAPPVGGTGILELSAGWHLLGGGEAKNLLNDLPSHRWVAYDARSASRPPEKRESGPRPTRRLHPHAPYWIYVAPSASESDIPREPPSLAPLSSTHPALIWAKKPLHVDALAPATVLTWDAQTGAPKEWTSGSTLAQGQVYWVRQPSPEESPSPDTDPLNQKPPHGTGLDVAPPARPAPGHGLHSSVDQEGPALLLDGPSHEDIYTPHYILSGRVWDRHLEGLELTNLRTGQHQSIAWEEGRFEHALTLTAGSHPLRLVALDRAGLTHTKSIEITVHEEPFVSDHAPRPPRSILAWSHGGRATFQWQAPRLLSNGRPIPKGVRPSYRLYRHPDPKPIALSDPRYEGPLPSTETTVWFITAVLPGTGDVSFESVPSARITLRPQPRKQVTKTGTFETPSIVTASPHRPTLPEMAIGRGPDAVHTHLTYVARGESDSGTDQIHYARSDRLAKGGSFSAPLTVAQANPGWFIQDVAIAAHREAVAIVWLAIQERGPDEGPAKSRVYAIQSQEAGYGFDETPMVVHESTGWKRGIDVGIDIHGDLHLVWGEAHRALYVKNLEGPPRSVFDETKRSINDEVVRYRRLYPASNCTDDHACDCLEPVPESYSLALEPNPQNGGAPFGLYLERTERNYVEHPSLHLDDQQITIAVRQTRSFDNRPVKNPNWAGRFGPYRQLAGPRTPEKALACPLLGAVARPEGFRQALRRHALDCNGMDNQWREADPSRTFYLVEGSWDERDHIKVAQRPLSPNAWSRVTTKTVRVPKLVGNFVHVVDEEREVEEGWRQGVWKDDTFLRWRINRVDTFDRQETASVSCDDPSTSLPLAEWGPAYPKVSGNKGGQLTVIYEKGPSHNPNAATGNPLMVARSLDRGQSWSSPEKWAQGYLPDAAFAADDTRAAVFYQAGNAGQPGSIQALVMPQKGEPSTPRPHLLSGQQAQPIHHRSHGQGADRLENAPRVVSHQGLLLATWVEAPKGEHDAPRIVTTRARITPEPETARFVLTAPSRTASGQSTPGAIECVDAFHMLSNRCAPTDAKTPPHQAIWAEASPHGAPTPAALEALRQAHPWVHLAAAEVDGPASSPTPHAELATSSEAPMLEAPSAAGNHARAQTLRDALFNPELGAQLEYLGDEDNDDTRYLAEFDRVWTYTQGIALAQYTRTRDPRAAPLAHFLCQHAERGQNGDGEAVIFGWPFSWNTRSDDWADARLVTGANAWAVHGLGTFITHRAFLDLNKDGQESLVACYFEALRGLEPHQNAGLMTAGRTTLGLVNQDEPHILGLEEPGIGWAYYEVLDAIGYRRYNPEDPPVVSRFAPGDPQSILEPRTLTAADFDALKVPTPATHVVTEHNLDQLSVLNHALKHWETIRSRAKPEYHPFEDALKRWRNRLRDAIFDKLWDPANERFITGGHFEGQSFHPSPVSAIDNCSWLSLSVDYPSLEEDHITKLEQCLDYTIAAFVKELPYQGQTYRGTHYFPNSFSDPYITPSNDHETLYHLEATAGLILGLKRFVDAHPEREQSSAFAQELDVLYTDMNRFVRDHGFPYSSRRMQDLMTVLDSSTAAIWFIDVYDEIQGGVRDLDRPLANYARGVDVRRAQTVIDDAWEALKGRALHNFEDRLFTAYAGPRLEDGRRDPAWGAYIGEGDPAQYRVRLWITEAGHERLATSSIRQVPGGDAPPMTEIADVPVNTTAVWVEAFARKRPPEGLLSHLNPWGLFDEVEIVLKGRVRDPPGSARTLMLTLIIDDVEWFVSLYHVGDSGEFEFAYPAGQEGFPNPTIDEEGWAPTAPGNRPLYQREDGQWTDVPPPGVEPEPIHNLPSTKADIQAVPVARLMSPTAPHIRASSVYRFGDYRGWEHLPWTAGAGVWSFHHRFGGHHRYEIIDISQGLGGVEDSLRGDTAAVGPVVSRRLAKSERPVTLLEDQALAIFAARQRRQRIHLNRVGSDSTWFREWSKALMSALETRTYDGEEYLQFPYFFDSETGTAIEPYYQTGMQFLALYALSSYEQYFKWTDAINAKLARLALSIRDLYGVSESDGRLLTEGGDPTAARSALGLEKRSLELETPPILHEKTGFPRTPILSLTDHIFAWVSVKHLGSILFHGDRETAHFLMRWADELYVAIVNDFWDAERGRLIPFLQLLPDGTTTKVESDVVHRGTAALYALALFHSQSMSETVLFRWKEAITWVAENEAPDAAPAWSADSNLLQSPLLPVLAQRAAARLDARLEELAWHEFGSLVPGASPSITELAGLAILEEPVGLFGHGAGHMFFTLPPSTEPFDLPAFADLDVRLPDSSGVNIPDLNEVRDRLRYRYTETLAGLLMSDQNDHVFDTLLHRLMNIGSAYDLYVQKVSVRDWPQTVLSTPQEDRLLETVHELRTLCEGTRLLGTSPDLRPLVGVSCEEASEGFQAALQKRLGPKPVTSLTLEHPNTDLGFELIQLARVVTMPRPRDFSVARFGNLDVDETDKRESTIYAMLAHEDSMADQAGGTLSNKLRRLWTQAAEKTVTTVTPPYYFTPEIDLIALKNSASPNYWHRTAIELRAIEKHEKTPRFHTGAISPQVALDQLLYAQPTWIPGGAFIISDEADYAFFQENVRQLRRFINRYHSGNLPDLAETAGLTPLRVHLMMRTGRITESDFDRLANAARLPPDEKDTTKSSFVFTPEDNMPSNDEDRSSSKHSEKLGTTELAGLGPPGVIATKSRTLVLKELARHFDDLLALPPELAAVTAVAPSVLSYAASLGLEVDPGLLGVFVGSAPPSPHAWEPVGLVRGEDLLAPFGTYLKDEDVLRTTVPVYTSTDLGRDPLLGPSILMNDDRIYHVTIDWMGVDQTPFGSLGILTFEDGALFEVHALKSAHPQSDILAAFVKNHLRMKKAEESLSFLPDAMKAQILFWIELTIRGEFSQKEAERYAHFRTPPVTYMANAPGVEDSPPPSNPTESTDTLKQEASKLPDASAHPSPELPLQPIGVVPPKEPQLGDGYGKSTQLMTLAALLRVSGMYVYSTAIPTSLKEHKRLTSPKNRAQTFILRNFAGLASVFLGTNKDMVQAVQTNFYEARHDLMNIHPVVDQALTPYPERSTAAIIEKLYALHKEELSPAKEKAGLWVPLHTVNPETGKGGPVLIGFSAFAEGLFGPNIRPRWGPPEENPNTLDPEIHEAKFPGPFAIIDVIPDPSAGALFETKRLYQPSQPFVRLENALLSMTLGQTYFVPACRVCRVPIEKTSAARVIDAMQTQFDDAFGVAKVIDDVFLPYRSIDLLAIKKKDPEEAFRVMSGQTGAALFGTALFLAFVPAIAKADGNTFEFEAEAIQIFMSSDWQVDRVLLKDVLKDLSPFELAPGPKPTVTLESYLRFLEDQWKEHLRMPQAGQTPLNPQETALNPQHRAALGFEPQAAAINTFNPINAFMHRTLQDDDERALYIATLNGPDTVQILRFWKEDATYPNGRMYFTPNQSVEEWNYWLLDEPNPTSAPDGD